MSTLKQAIAGTTVALDLEEYLAVTTMGGNAALDTSHDCSCSASGQIVQTIPLSRFA
jgi:hypothetical protein